MSVWALVERVEQRNGKAICGGAAHDSAIDLASIRAVFVDRTAKMKDKVLPRVEFHGADGKALFSFVGLDGLEPFDAGLDGASGVPVAEKTKEQSEQAVLNDGDPGSAPLDKASAAGAEVVIELTRPGLTQSWRGIIESVKPAMGFINVMRPDFHLHLRGGAIARWRRDALPGGIVEMVAENARGEATGLVVRGRKRLCDRAGYAQSQRTVSRKPQFLRSRVYLGCSPD